MRTFTARIRPGLATLLVLSTFGGNAAFAAVDAKHHAESADMRGPTDASRQTWRDLDDKARTQRVRAWRDAGRERLDAAHRAVWTTDDPATRACRERRRDHAKTYLDTLDALAGSLTLPTPDFARQDAALGVLQQAWHPVQAVEPDAPCDAPEPHTGPEVAWTAPAFDGLADLPEPLVDDPMSLGGDFSGRRTLRR